MKLSDLTTKGLLPPGTSLARDGTFEALGYITHRINTKPFLAFVGNGKFLKAALGNPLVTALVAPPDLASDVPDHLGLLTSLKPHEDFFWIHKNLVNHSSLYWRDFETTIHPTAKVSPAAHVAAMNVEIGANSVIAPGAVVLEKVKIGANCFIGSNSVVGSEGFEAKWLDGALTFIEHGHGVVIEDNVRVHAGCTIDKGVFGDATTIRANSFLDNLVHVAHGVHIGSNCLIAAGVVFAAAVVVEDGARIDPNAVLTHEITIGEKSYVTMGAVVVEDVPAGARVTGNFAYPHRQFIKNFVASRNPVRGKPEPA
jgi:acetyltransferase-like isoleucine patch superfamily enzyme